MNALLLLTCAALTVGVSHAAAGDIIGFYKTRTDVSKHALIDLDVKDIGASLSEDPVTQADIDEAEFIFKSGRNSIKSATKNRTLAGFSTGLDAKYKAGQEVFPDFLKEYNLFKEYYDNEQYAANFVTEQLDIEVDKDIRKQIAVKGSQYTVVAIYSLYELYSAVKKCKLPDSEASEKGKQYDTTHAWDEGMAFYAGSLMTDLKNNDANTKGENVGEYGEKGQLSYTLAEKRCGYFGTCTGKGINEPVSRANNEIKNAYERGVLALEENKCDEALKEILFIRKWMQIPLIQGTLLYTYKTDPAVTRIGEEKAASKKGMAEAWAFAYAILPYMDQVDKDATKVIRENVQLQSDLSNFNKDGHKKVFENMFDVMEKLCISCEEVGIEFFVKESGLNVDNSIKCEIDDENFENCAYLTPTETPTDYGLIVGLCVALVAVLAVIGLAMRYLGQEEKSVPVEEVANAA